MKFFSLILAISALAISHSSYCQAFIAAASNVPGNTPAWVEKTDGTVLEGTIQSSVMMNGALRSIRLKDAEGVNYKLKADEVAFIKVKPGVLGKLDMMVEKSSSLAEMAQTNFDEIIDREWIYYEQILSPGKNPKPLLLQKVNPGFDERIKVYNDPNAAETGSLMSGDVTLTGGEDRSYIAVNEKGEAFYIRKASYDKKIRELLSDCPYLLSKYEGQKMRFNDLAQHVYIYNTMCR
ncbi:MAG TPA: hypothetical protein PLK12_05525 [Prolixibacteraceae bacterium]|nr:hypothetical protein [Prolixibacteraceae bacterium]